MLADQQLPLRLWHIFLRDTAAHSICIAEHLRYLGNDFESVGERLFAGCVPPGNHTDDLVGTAKFLVDADGVRADLSGGIPVYLAGAISKVDPVFGDKGRHRQQNEQDKHRDLHLHHEVRKSAERRHEAAMLRFVNQLITQYRQTWQKDQHAQQREHDSLRHDNAHIRPDAETHQDQSGKTDHGGECAGGHGRKAVLYRVRHGILYIHPARPETGKAVQQKNRIVHADGELQHAARCIRHKADGPECKIRAHVQNDSHTDGCHEKHRFKPARGGEQQNQEYQWKRNGHNHL